MLSTDGSNALLLQLLRAFVSVAMNALNSGLLARLRWPAYRFTPAQDARQFEHVGRMHVADAAENSEQFGQVDELGEPRVHAVAPRVRREFERGDRLDEVRRPGIVKDVLPGVTLRSASMSGAR